MVRKIVYSQTLFFVVFLLSSCSSVPTPTQPSTPVEITNAPTARPTEKPKSTLAAALATPSLTTAPTVAIDVSPTLDSTVKPKLEVTPDISKLPADIQSIGPDAKYFQIQPDKSIIDTRDGSTAYDKDGKLIGFKYGNWDNVAHPENVSIAGTRCVETKTACIRPAVSSSYKGLSVYRTNAVSTGAFIHEPIADPNNGMVFGTADFVIMKTLSQKGDSMLFSYLCKYWNHNMVK